MSWKTIGDGVIPTRQGDVFVCEHEEYGLFWGRVLYAKACCPINGPPHLVVERYAIVGGTRDSIPALDRSNLLGAPMFLDMQIWEDLLVEVVGNQPFDEGELPKRGVFQLGNEYHDEFCVAYEAGFEPEGEALESGEASTAGYLSLMERTAKGRPERLTWLD